MFKYIKQFVLFLLPILKQATVQVAADELTKMAYPPKQPLRRTSYDPSGGYRPYREPKTRRQATMNLGRAFQEAQRFQADYEEPRTGKFQEYSENIKAANFHDVLMVAFDLTGPNAAVVHEWLASQMPSTGKTPLGYVKGAEVYLDAWWVANDERFDGCDLDSAVFVSKGNQEAARALLREHGLVD